MVVDIGTEVVATPWAVLLHPSPSELQAHEFDQTILEHVRDAV